MSLNVKVKVGPFDILHVEKELGEFRKKAPNVISRSMNRAIQNMRTSANKKSREQYYVKASDVNKSFKISKATASKLYAEAKSIGPLIGLEKYRVTPRTASNRKGSKVRAAVKKGPKKTINRAFLRMDKNGMVSQREGKKRLPIRRLMGPAIPQILKNNEVVEYTQLQGEETFRKRLDHEISRLLGR